MGRAEAIQRWTDSVADRLGVTVWGFLAGIAAVVAAGLGGWWALASPEVAPVEDVLPRAATAPGAPAAAEPISGPEGRIVVHVEGAVVFPGVHDLAEGSRVHDAIDAANGLTADADRSRLNLAAPLTDGQRVWVPVIGEPEPPVVGPSDPGGGSGGGSSGTLVNLNTADLAALETLPGIGPSIAAAIVRHREQHGAFSRVEALLDVPGIGEAKLEQLASLVSV